MKKSKIVFISTYVIAYILIFALIITKGIKIEFIIRHFDDYLDKGIIDGFSGTISILIVNFLISICIFTISLIMTLKKENEIKFKKFFLVGIIILLLFVPTYVKNISGGFAGINNKTYYNILIIPIKTN